MLVRQLMIRAGADFSAMRREMRSAQGALDGFKRSVAVSMKGIAASLATLGAGLGISSAIKDAMAVEASLQQVNRIMQNSAGEFKKWADENAIAFGVSRSEAVRYGAVFSNLIATFSSGARETMTMTKDILKASAVISGATGRDMEDVMFRIRSGLLGNTEAIEDLGVNVNVAMLETTEAFRRFAGDKSWLQLDFQTQQQIRLFGILEQTTKKYGDTVAKNTASDLGTLVAHLRDAKLALGQAFLPIINIVLPALTELAAKLSSVMNVIAQFSQALFGKGGVSSQAQTQSTAAQAGTVEDLGDAYTEAGKAAKKAAGSVQGFDEVNTISDPSTDTGSIAAITGGLTSGVGAAAGGVGGFAQVTLEASQKIKEMSENIKKAFKNLVADENMKKLGSAFADMKQSFNQLGQAMADFFATPAVASVTNWLSKTLSTKFIQARTSDMNLLSGIFQSWAGTFQVLEGFVKLDFSKMLGGVQTWAQGVGKEFEGLIGIIFPNFVEDMKGWWTKTKTATSEKWEEIKSVISVAWDSLKTFVKWNNIKTTISTVWTDIKKDTSTNWEKIKEAVSEKWDSFKDFVKWDNIKTLLSGKWTDIKTAAGTSWDAIKQEVSDKWDAFQAFIKWDDIKTTVNGKWDAIKTDAGTKWTELKEKISEKWGDIVKLDFNGVKDGLLTIWETMSTETGTIFDQMGSNIKKTINAIIDSVNGFIDKVSSFKIEIPAVSIMGKELSPGFTISMPNMPKIPRLARGGVVDGRTNMGNYIAGEAGAEMIVPLENTSFTDKIASALGNAVMTAMSMGQGKGEGDTIIQINGVEIARALQPYTAGENNRLGGSMLRTT